MNYVAHLNRALNRFNKDMRVRPMHVSLYMACFHLWNLERFPKWLPISRAELMQRARIQSKSTYHRVMKDLNNWGYLTYKPSRNPRKGSKIKITRRSLLSVPGDGHVEQSTSPPVGHQCPTGGLVTIYNKHENIKEVFIKKKNVLETKLLEQGMSESDIEKYHHWLLKHFPEKELLELDWFSMIPNWQKEIELIANGQEVSHFRDYLKITKVKRYDQPL